MKDDMNVNTGKNIDIDLVYMWVDGNDPEWLKKHNAYADNSKKITEINCKGRHANNDELKYSLRSVEKFAPWIRKIFIVTNDQTPEWLNTSHPKVKIIDHSEIIPEAGRPCFNSNVIQHYLYKIPGLSEHFLFSNDDMFFYDGVGPGFFFAEDGYPIVRLKKLPFGKLHYWAKLLRKKGAGNYATVIHRAAILVEKKFGKYYSGVPHHNIEAYKKSDYREAVEEVFAEQANRSLTHRFRDDDDFDITAIQYYTIAIKHGHLKYVKNKESMRIPVYHKDPMTRLLSMCPKLFCLNDCQRTTDDDRARIAPFLEALFPNRSSFEKQNGGPSNE